MSDVASIFGWCFERIQKLAFYMFFTNFLFCILLFYLSFFIIANTKKNMFHSFNLLFFFCFSFFCEYKILWKNIFVSSESCTADKYINHNRFIKPYKCMSAIAHLSHDSWVSILLGWKKNEKINAMHKRILKLVEILDNLHVFSKYRFLMEFRFRSK